MIDLILYFVALFAASAGMIAALGLLFVFIGGLHE